MDTALLLDNGIVCGGQIEVFRYGEQGRKVPEQFRLLIEKLARQLVATAGQQPLLSFEQTPRQPNQAQVVQ